MSAETGSVFCCAKQLPDSVITSLLLGNLAMDPAVDVRSAI